MDLSTIWQFLPYAARINKAVQTLQRLEADPDVQDAIKLAEELSALIVKAQKPLQTG